MGTRYDDLKPIVAGICKRASELGQEPPLIGTAFLDGGYQRYPHPQDSQEKVRAFLELLYEVGDKGIRPFRPLHPDIDKALLYTSSDDEAEQLLEHLQSEGLVTYKLGDNGMYFDLKLTKNGRDQVESGLKVLPLAGLLREDILTGSEATDTRIRHARELFFQEPQTMELMRSACVELASVLESMRKGLATYFSSTDEDTFFAVVNKFDIRHNNERTKQLEYPEQLEWVFYTLLNTINTYVKLRNRLVTT